MRTQVACVAPEDGVDSVVARLVESPIGCVLVQTDGIPVGIVTNEDVVRAAVGACAREVMSSCALTLSPHADTLLALALMAYEGVSHILVVSDSRAALGVVTAQDVLVAVAREAGYVIPDRALDGGSRAAR